MKRFSFSAIIAVTFLAFATTSLAAEAKAQLQELVGKVRAKLSAGKKTEQDLSEELKAFDALLAEHKGEKTDDVAQILIMKGMLYGEVLENDEKAAEILKQVQTDFPGTQAAKQAESTITAMAAQAEGNKIQRSLKEGTAFPDFEEKDLAGNPLSIGKFKGQVVLVDFWATWCGPCIAELPNVLSAYEKHHDKGFEIIGISLDRDRAKLDEFLKEKKMTWPQYFDGQAWQSKLAVKYGVNSIPATYLLDKEGKIIGKGLRGEALETAVAAALK